MEHSLHPLLYLDHLISLHNAASASDTFDFIFHFVFFLAVVKTPLGGDFVTMQCKQYFEDEKIEMIHPYFIASKVRVSSFQRRGGRKRSGFKCTMPLTLLFHTASAHFTDAR